MVFLDFLARIAAQAAQQQRDASAAQARQQQADRFADAWNRGAISIPPRLAWPVPCPDGSTAHAWPRCTATAGDGGSWLLTFEVPPDTAVTTDDVARHADSIRLAARQFFGVRLRLTGGDVAANRCTMAMSQVMPMCDAAQNFLAGFDDRGEPVWVPILGQATAVSGDDGCASWISACVSGVIPTTTAAPADAVDAALHAGRAARKTGQPPSPLVVGLGDAVVSDVQKSAELLGFARRGLVEWSASQVDSASWAVRPTQVITRSGDSYLIERDGRRTRFIPAWLY